LFAIGSTPAAMADLSEATILGHIRQLGLARTKARNVKRLAALLLERHGGEVPRSFDALEALPGVGHKTASVVMAQAFGVPAFPVDTHIHRLAQRWGLSSGQSVAQTERDLKRLFPKDSWNKLHLQIIFYGREFCTARTCDGTICSLCRELYPRRRSPVIWRKP
jgi:endonuclease-3